MDIIRNAYYIRGLELMKLIFAALDVSLTMGLTGCYKIKVFTFIFPVFLAYIFYTISIRYTRLRRRKSICIPNLDEISQPTAEIKVRSSFG